MLWKNLSIQSTASKYCKNSKRPCQLLKNISQFDPKSRYFSISSRILAETEFLGQVTFEIEHEKETFAEKQTVQLILEFHFNKTALNCQKYGLLAPHHTNNQENGLCY